MGKFPNAWNVAGARHQARRTDLVRILKMGSARGKVLRCGGVQERVDATNERRSRAEREGALQVCWQSAAADAPLLEELIGWFKLGWIVGSSA